MTSQTPINQGPIETPVPSSGEDDRSPFGSPYDEAPFLQDTVSDIRELVARSVRNGDACIGSLNKFGTSVAEWNRQIFERLVSDQRLQHDLISATQDVVDLRVALEKEKAACDALRQAVATEKEKTNEMAIQLGAYRASSLTFLEVNKELSQALYNLTTLATVASRG
jgi:hypothetical protein